MCGCWYCGDEFLADIMMNDVSLTGNGHKTQQFEDDERKPALSDVQLMRSSRWTRPKVMGSQSGTQGEDVKAELWQSAVEEVSKV